MTKRNMLFKLH